MKERRCLKIDDNTIKVTTYLDDKNLLLRRLLRYGDSCEVIYPNTVKHKIAETIKNTLENYGEIV